MANWKEGFLYGLLGTLAMSIIMLIGVGTGMAPMPKPIPSALVGSLLGLTGGAAKIVAILAHFGYGGFFGSVYTYVVDESTVWAGLGFGAVLWLLMQLLFLPILGWGFFGTAVTPAIGVATLVLHLIYGGTLGWGVR